MKPLLALITPCLLLMAGAAGARPGPHDVSTLATFDLGFAKCEARFEHMKGHRDEAFLALWKRPLNAQQSAQLARKRKTAAYRQARTQAQSRLVHEQAGMNNAELEDKIRQQCAATWREVENRPARPTPGRP